MPKTNPIETQPVKCPLKREDASFDLVNPKMANLYQAVKQTTGDDTRENILRLRRDIRELSGR